MDDIQFYQHVLSRALAPETKAVLRAEVLRFQPDIETVERTVGRRHALYYLAQWFKTSYMRWLPEVPECKTCNVPMEMSLYGLTAIFELVPDRTSWTGYKRFPLPDKENPCKKVERYECLTCHRVEVVSRENDVRVLMRTRLGRCGEHAVLFTAFCLALGWPARLILDSVDDHVWTEVAMEDGTWIPVDPSVTNHDRLQKDPYLFESWKWKLDHVIAIEPGKLSVEVGRSYRRPTLT